METKPTCRQPDCEAPATSRGWCRVHYQRWYRTGSPLRASEGGHPNGVRKPRTAAEFVAHLKSRATHAPDGCWVWPIESGKSVAVWKGKLVSVARVLWTDHYRCVPKERLYRVCRNVRCVSPLHRREGGKYAPWPGPRERWPEEHRDWEPGDVSLAERKRIDRFRETKRGADYFARTGFYLDT